MGRSAILSNRYVKALLGSVGEDWPIYAAAAAYVVAGNIFVVNADHIALGMLGHYAKTWTIHFSMIGPFCVLLAGMIHIAIRMKGRKRLAYRTMIAPERMGRFLAGTILLLTAGLLFMSTFSSVKTALPLGRDFMFDIVQADIDKALHFGVDPWRLLAFAQHPWVLSVLEFNYSVIWFLLCYFPLYWVATSPRTRTVRVRYILCWFLSWIIVGNLMAGYWLSAGPAYYGYVTGDTARFAEQLAFLESNAGQPSSAYNFQAYLWNLHSTGQFGIGSGISAFPSMHVALVTLNALFLGEYSRRLALAMWAYVALVLFSSVYLGWHYAIDGYASLVTITALYWALRKGLPMVARWRNRPLETAPESSYAQT